ncbi:hypothetical protein [Ferrovibrio sp.]|uniref:hypothetical protein n=1 Tax=Ferrovibrio sp. TaxID=1917215 RepID=UPI0025C1D91A|nr:hypothetical protein [Ferrovibrio sp.]MBX3455156.1 hypothetical protein [Ferrovibrio sp.]
MQTYDGGMKPEDAYADSLLQIHRELGAFMAEVQDALNDGDPRCTPSWAKSWERVRSEFEVRIAELEAARLIARNDL